MSPQMLPTKGDSFFNNIDHFLTDFVGQICSFFKDLFTSDSSKTGPESRTSRGIVSSRASDPDSTLGAQNPRYSGRDFTAAGPANYGTRNTSFASSLDQDSRFSSRIRSGFNGSSFAMQASYAPAPAYAYGGGMRFHGGGGGGHGWHRR
jgi:hypothetical protein